MFSLTQLKVVHEMQHY